MKTILFVSCMAASTFAFAATEQKFTWSSVELGSAGGVVSTYQRVEQFAQGYCQKALSGTLGGQRFMACRVHVAKEVVSKIGDARLTAYAQTGKADSALVAQK